MALTDTAKMNVMFYLGWPSKSLVVDSTHYNRTLATRLESISAEAETIVIELLAAIDTVRTKLEASQGRALVKKVGDIELNTEEAGSLKKESARLINELSAFLDIPNQTKYGRTNISVVV